MAIDQNLEIVNRGKLTEMMIKEKSVMRGRNKLLLDKKSLSLKLDIYLPGFHQQFFREYKV